MGQKGMPTYREISWGAKLACTARLAWAQATASFRRRGETWYWSRSIPSAWAGVAPAARARVGSFTGRTPESIPQGGSAPRQSTAAR